MATIYDVAKLANVSIATVSRVINNSSSVSDKTKKKVLQVMKELDFTPSMVAAALVKKSTFTIGLLIPDISNPFFAEIARGVEDEGNRYGFNVIICNTDNNTDKESSYINFLLQKGVDGIVFATAHLSSSNVKALAEKGFPVVLIARDVDGVQVDSVVVDNYQGAYDATKHLITLGHKRIGLIGESLTIKSSVDRLKGYRQALTDGGIEFEDEWLVSGVVNLNGSREMVEHFLRLTKPPTALFAVNDILAIGAIRGIKEHGLKVPHDISVVGFDNTILASIVDPPLTTVAQPMQEMGAIAMRRLLERIKREEGAKLKAERIVLPAQLVIRHSTIGYFEDNRKLASL